MAQSQTITPGNGVFSSRENFETAVARVLRIVLRAALAMAV